MTRTLLDGDVLDSSKHSYTLTFPKGELPPVNSFWSVTMYDGKTQFLIENPINRYLINSPMLPNMKKNADGSLTLYIQKGSPGADKEANWLPAPNDTIYLVMRLYWPKEEAQPLFDCVLHNIELALVRGRIHADLSAHNILYWERKVTLIDFAQAVDPYHNSDVFSLFARDVERTCQYFARYGVKRDAHELARAIWTRHMGPIPELV